MAGRLFFVLIICATFTDAVAVIPMPGTLIIGDKAGNGNVVSQVARFVPPAALKPVRPRRYVYGPDWEARVVPKCHQHGCMQLLLTSSPRSSRANWSLRRVRG